MQTIVPTLIKEHERVIAIVGAGGKTSLMFLLAKAFLQTGKKVITTTTTRIQHPDRGQSPRVVLLQESDFFDKLERELALYHHVTIARHLLPENKLAGLSPEKLEQIFSQSSADRLITEADGARCLPLKAPGDNEPVVPRQPEVFISLLGLDCLGNPLTDATAFRPEKIASITGLHLGDEITVEAVASLAIHPQGMLKGCPKQARSIVFLNKTDIANGQLLAEKVIESARQKQGIQPDVWAAGSIRVNNIVFSVHK